MREILFRGKTPRTHNWVYGCLIRWPEYCCILERPEDLHEINHPYLNNDFGWIDGQATPVIPETVGQWTGLEDKNGSKIFEGDIVRAMMDYGPAGMIERVVDIWFKKYDGYRWSYFDLNTIEVIGNVYENIGLLER